MTDVILLLLHSSTWNHLALCKQMIDIRIRHIYLKPFNCVPKKKKNKELMVI